jgi:hypothetical protein
VTRSRRSRALLILAALAVLVAVPATIAAFSATASNSGNSFQAAPIFPGALKMATGTYAGNSVNNRAITGLGFQPDVVIVKGNSAVEAVARTSTMTGDATKPLIGATGLTANYIKSLNADGFTVGTSSRVNITGTTYYWTAVKANAGALKVGTYTGNGGAQSITGAGFQPEYVAVLGTPAQRAVQRFAGMTRGFQFDADLGTTTRITSLNADGFSVGTSAEVSTAGQTYHYIAFNDSPGAIKVASYTGNNTDNRSITGAGFQPQYVMLRANDTATARRGYARPASLTGDNTLYFEALANANNRIQALQADGFQVGTDVSANATGVTYYYLGLNSNAP